MRNVLKQVYDSLDAVAGNTGALAGMSLGLIAATVGVGVGIFGVLMGIVYGLVAPFNPGVKTVENINLVLMAIAVGAEIALILVILVTKGPRRILGKLRRLFSEITKES